MDQFSEISITEIDFSNVAGATLPKSLVDIFLRIFQELRIKFPE